MHNKAQAENTATIPFDKALEEVNKWLDHKRYPQSKRETNMDNVELLANAISDGYVVIKEDKQIEHTLLIPIENKEGEITVTSIEYRDKLNSLDIDPWLKGVKSDDGIGLINAHICALTKKNRNIIKSLDTTDLHVARAIAGFFLQ